MYDTVQITVDDDGNLVFITDDHVDLHHLGTVKTKRASHVEPDGYILRWLFHLLRNRCGDNSKVANWTRTWKCLWRVNMKPSNGPVLSGRWLNRAAALKVERQWLLENIL